MAGYEAEVREVAWLCQLVPPWPACFVLHRALATLATLATGSRMASRGSRAKGTLSGPCTGAKEVTCSVIQVNRQHRAW